MQIDTAKFVASKQKSRRQNVYDLENTLAGAEGFEPSARGFGVAVGNDFLYNVPLLSQTLTTP